MNVCMVLKLLVYWFLFFLAAFLFLGGSRLNVITLLTVSLLLSVWTIYYGWSIKRLCIHLILALLIRILYVIYKFIIKIIRVILESPEDLLELIHFLQIEAKSPYHYLGLDCKASKDEIRRRYYQLVYYFHPDVNVLGQNESWILDLHKQITQAHQLLSKDSLKDLLILYDQYFGQKNELRSYHSPGHSQSYHSPSSLLSSLEGFFFIWPVENPNPKPKSNKILLIRFSLAYLKIFRQWQRYRITYLP